MEAMIRNSPPVGYVVHARRLGHACLLHLATYLAQLLTDRECRPCKHAGYFHPLDRLGDDAILDSKLAQRTQCGSADVHGTSLRETFLFSGSLISVPFFYP